MRHTGRTEMVCCKALACIGGRTTQLLLNQLVKVSIQTCSCSSNLCSELDWCQMEIEPCRFRRYVPGKQGDILKGDAGRFERRQPLVAQSMWVQLRELERGAQCFDHVIEGARHERTTRITRRLRDEQRPAFIEGESVDESPALVIEIVVQHALANG